MFSKALQYLVGGRLTSTLWGSSFADCQPHKTWTSPPESKKIRRPPCFTVSSACLTVLGLSIPGRKMRIASLLALPSCLLRTLRLTPSIQPPPTCTFKLKTGGWGGASTKNTTLQRLYALYLCLQNVVFQGLHYLMYRNGASRASVHPQGRPPAPALSYQAIHRKNLPLCTAATTQGPTLWVTRGV